MKIKVCGMREEKNLLEILEEPPDFIGLIFYEKSPRFVGNLSPQITDMIPAYIGKTGVFVNAGVDEIKEKVEYYKLDLVQLHGRETPDFCNSLKEILKSYGTKIIKVFNVGKAFNFKETIPYESIVDYFLFDTKGKLPGGNGEVFNWELLKAYKGKTPFFLSGGIGLEHVEILEKLELEQLYAVDVNSKFEDAPALKNVAQTHDFVIQIRKI